MNIIKRIIINTLDFFGWCNQMVALPLAKKLVKRQPHNHFVGITRRLEKQNLPRKKMPAYVNRSRNPRRIVNVKPNPLPYYLENGWRKSGNVFHGYYRCKIRSFRGEIVERAGGKYKFYIYNPPAEVFSGTHSACFTLAGVGRYHVHFGTDANDLNSGIMAVERVICCDLKRRK